MDVISARRDSEDRTRDPIPPEFLAQIRRIEIRARRLVANIFVGEYHSVFRGRGIEFSEVRQYDPGDDVRAIDWNVTARMGTPYVKKYIEERELTVLLAVDLSASSRFTSTGATKRALAGEVAATLAFAAVANGDRVGLVAFTDRIECFVPPRKDRRHVLRVIRELLYRQPEGTGTDIGRALAYIARVTRRRAIVFLMSDFFDSGFEQQLRAAALRHEVVAVTLTDPREETLPDAGLIEMEDLETGARAMLDTADSNVRAAWARRSTELRSARARSFAAANVDEISLRTDASYVEPLLRAFRRRERRR
jgi:uncharacterized protein (DUF58 family)